MNMYGDSPDPSEDANLYYALIEAAEAEDLTPNSTVSMKSLTTLCNTEKCLLYGSYKAVASVGFKAKYGQIAELNKKFNVNVNYASRLASKLENGVSVEDK